MKFRYALAIAVFWSLAVGIAVVAIGSLLVFALFLACSFGVGCLLATLSD